ncbi:unnamed protein product (macronuclear) [Paramecium tetraurelia]|uniref:Uncharacterized protein n=1 Tax=Paramecium tetraurelia TaxID=5888 RepID=A0D2R4_PARTE|nr:uncharacterized protein GSPATT00012839001 [Paramecium tetraurelia]CAK77331.1 unnamed protein product [Paramecium tetraurelia]|eukprot:XP_001444728.1 hypothetical protein (macronuclear) [Paramecium tetraurelia strain d4-2]
MQSNVQTYAFKKISSEVAVRSRGTSIERFQTQDNAQLLFQNQRLRTQLVVSKQGSDSNIGLMNGAQNKKTTLKITTRIYNNYLLNGCRPNKKKSLPILHISPKPLPLFLLPNSKSSSQKACTTRTCSQADIKKFQFKTLFNDI